MQETYKTGLFYLLIWAGYLILSPIYILPKGLPQPADIMIIIAALPALALSFSNFKGNLSYIFLCAFAFAALASIINLTHFSFSPDRRFLLSIFYYPYNILVFGFVAYIFGQSSEQIRKYSYWALSIAILAQFIWAAFIPDSDNWRATGGFDNPNQLAYWSLLSAGMLIILRGENRFTIIDISLFGLTGLTQALALSKAGMISFTLLFLVLFFSQRITHAMRAALFTIILAAAFIFALSPNLGSALSAKADIAHNVITRLASLGLEADDSLIGRGYDRIISHPEYLIFGAGEGGFDRFQNNGGPKELHSGLATLLFSYGFTGFILFLTFLFLIFRRERFLVLTVLGCILMFSLTHQAFRFTHFWVFLGMVYGIQQSRIHNRIVPDHAHNENA